MAIFHMQINTVSRSSGRNAPASAAYRAGERIRNERTCAVYDHRARQDVLHKEIVLPARLAGATGALAWARERASLWNAAERIEPQANSRVAREYMVALPAELPAPERVELARAFSREIADRYNVAVDLAVHAPRPFADPRNFHAHLLTTTREVRPEGLGPKTGLDMNGTARAELGLPSARSEFSALRMRWAELVNERLRAASLEARVDARSLAAQGIEREPQPRLPWGALRAERRGERSEIAERIRARYRARVAARAGSIERGASAARTRDTTAGAPDPAAASASEQRRRQAVREWLAYREAQARGAEPAPGSVPIDAERVRQEALEAWRNRQAREGERRERVGGREGVRESGPAADGPAARPGRSRDFSL